MSLAGQQVVPVGCVVELALLCRRASRPTLVNTDFVFSFVSHHCITWCHRTTLESSVLRPQKVCLILEQYELYLGELSRKQLDLDLVFQTSLSHPDQDDLDD